MHMMVNSLPQHSVIDYMVLVVVAMRVVTVLLLMVCLQV